MKYVCDAPGGRTWFQLVTEAEAEQESQAMRHAVEKYFRREREKAAQSFRPVSSAFIEQEIGKEAHITRVMPLFLTLRDQEGLPLVTAMMPPAGKPDRSFGCILVGAGNGDPYTRHGDAIEALSRHFGIPLERAHCYPYRR
jgi:hypothetical protein